MYQQARAFVFPGEDDFGITPYCRVHQRRPPVFVLHIDPCPRRHKSRAQWEISSLGCNHESRLVFLVAEIYVDEERLVPLRYSAYDWPAKEGAKPSLMEEYIYRDLKLNVGLQEKDFDPDNEEYDFP